MLRNQTIRWNSPLNYNDPFDCYFSMGFNFHLAQFREQAINRLVNTLLGADEPAFELSNPLALGYSKLRKIRTKLSEEEIRREIIAGIDESIEIFTAGFVQEEKRWRSELGRYRLLCVCEEPDNILLWSHYADEHKGVVFQFDCLKEIDAPLLAAKPVIYADEPPTIATPEEWIEVLCGLRSPPAAPTYWHQLMHTKSTVWKEEKEWRVVTTARHYDHGLFEDTNFDPREISRMYFGCRISAEDRRELLELASGSFAHLEVYEAAQNPRSFGICFKRIK